MTTTNKTSAKTLANSAFTKDFFEFDICLNGIEFEVSVVCDENDDVNYTIDDACPVTNKVTSARALRDYAQGGARSKAMLDAIDKALEAEYEICL